MNAICMIMIVRSIGAGLFFGSQGQVRGVIKVDDPVTGYYVMDFSKEAKKLDYYGDYSEKSVPRNMCTVIK